MGSIAKGLRRSEKMRQYFDGRHVLVSGGSSGIGKAISLSVATLGASVTVLARDEEKLRSTVSELEALRCRSSQRFSMHMADVRVPEHVSAAVAAAEQAAPIHYLVNSAGVAVPGYVEDQSLEVLHDTIGTNLLGAISVTKAVLPGLVRRRHGHIVNISSVAGFIGVFGYTAYCASKFGLNGFSESLRAEMKRFDVRVSLCFPPETDTPMVAKERLTQPLESRAINSSAGIMKADDVAWSTLRGSEVEAQRRQDHSRPRYASGPAAACRKAGKSGNSARSTISMRVPAAST